MPSSSQNAPETSQITSLNVQLATGNVPETLQIPWLHPHRSGKTFYAHQYICTYIYIYMYNVYIYIDVYSSVKNVWRTCFRLLSHSLSHIVWFPLFTTFSCLPMCSCLCCRALYVLDGSFRLSPRTWSLLSHALCFVSATDATSVVLGNLAGHTESTFDFCRLAGLTPVGLLAELVPSELAQFFCASSRFP